MSKKKKKNGKISKKSKMNLEQLSNVVYEANDVDDEYKTVRRGRPSKSEEPRVTMSIRITDERKQILKLYAAKHNMTVSDLISSYVEDLTKGGY